MATTIAELLISIGVSVEGAAKAEKEIGGVTKAAAKTKSKGGLDLKSFAKTAGKAFAVVATGALAAAGAVFKLVESVASAGDQAAKDAKKLGLTAEAVQELGFAAQQSGADFNTVKTGLQAFSRGLDDAITKGTGPAKEAFDRLGLSIDDPILKSQDLEKILPLLADRFKEMPDSAEKTALAMKLFSKSGAELIPLLNEGADGIADMRREARDLGLVISNETAKSSEAFIDNLGRLKATVTGVVNEVGARLIPIVEKLVIQVTDWVKANKDLIGGKVEDFIKGLIKVGKEFLPVLIDFGRQIVELVKFISGPGGLTVAMIALGLSIGGLPGLAIAAAAALGGFLATVASDLSGLNEEIRETQRLQKETAAIRLTTGELKDAGTRIERGIQAQVGIDKLLAARDDPELLARVPQSRLDAVFEAAIGGASTESAKELIIGQFQDINAVRNAEIAKRDRIRTERKRNANARKSREAASAARTKGRGAAPKAGAVTSDVTFAEALIAVKTNQADPEQLKLVIQRLSKKTPSTKSIKPTVAIDFFNFQITQNFRGSNAVDMGRESAEAIRGEFQKATARTGQNIAGNIVR